MTSFALPNECYLSDVLVCEVDESGSVLSARHDHAAAMTLRTIEYGDCVLFDDDSLPDGVAAALSVPIYCHGHINSVVIFCGRAPDEEVADPVGIFEIWQPVGPHDEVALRDGFYGRMERFQNVSSFVRFERGSGLPGLAWKNRLSLVQDDLANHPGFLRAAGASADLLQSAVGIPVASEAYCSTAVLISSKCTPLAQGMEVWKVKDGSFKLTSRAYMDVEDAFRLDVGTTVSASEGILADVVRHGRAMLVENVTSLLRPRSADFSMPGPTAGLAMPFFCGRTLTSITLFHF